LRPLRADWRLKRAKELRPFAITLDVMMPDLDGWSVLAALQQDAELAACRNDGMSKLNKRFSAQKGSGKGSLLLLARALLRFSSNRKKHYRYLQPGA
jgi:CheY-like chemotaxis protein